MKPKNTDEIFRCCANPPCRTSKNKIRLFFSSKRFNEHNLHYHPELVFQPLSMISLPKKGWIIYPDDKNENLWHIQRTLKEKVVDEEDADADAVEEEMEGEEEDADAAAVVMLESGMEGDDKEEADVVKVPSKSVIGKISSFHEASSLTTPGKVNN